MSDIKISVAMTTYNGDKYLQPLLDSLFSQTVLPNEVIIVDDCSSDNTLKIINEYKCKYPIKCFVNEQNLGVNKNFEKSVSFCSGDYILLCDQDDVWLPNNIETKINILESMPKDIPAFIGSPSILVNNNFDKIISFGTKKNTFDYLTVWFTPFQGATIAINRQLASLLGEWPNNFKTLPFDSFIRYAGVLTGNVCGIAEPLMYYRHHENNTELKINKFLLPFKKNVLVLMMQQALLVKRIKDTKWVIEQLPESKIIASRLSLFNKIIACVEKDKISWVRFFSINEITLSKKIYTYCGSTLRKWKNKFKSSILSKFK